MEYNEEEIKAIIDVLIKEDRTEEISEISKKFPESPIIQEKMIKVLIMKGKTEEAKEIAKKFPESSTIQIRIMKLLIYQRKPKEAKKIAKKFPDNEFIQFLMIKILLQEGKTEEAKKIGSKFINAIPIQTKMMELLIKEEKIEEAKEIAKKFPESSRTALKRQYIKEKYNKKNNKIDNSLIAKENKSIDARKTINLIYNKGDVKEIQEQIERIPLRIEQLICYCAFFEQFDMRELGMQKFKEIKNSVVDVTSEFSKRENKVINILIERLKNKKAFFIPGFYLDILNNYRINSNYR